MRDTDSRRGRTSGGVRHKVPRSGVRAPRAREKNATGEDARLTPSSGNVFADLGFSPGEAEHLLVRSRLMLAIGQLIKEQGFTQSRAARLFGVTQPRVSDLVRGRIELFS